MKFLSRALLCFVLSFTMIELPLVKSAHANTQMISTTVAMEDLNRSAQEANLHKLLDRQDVKDQLVKLGVNPDEANRRIASLSDAELKKLSSEIDHQTAGGSVVGVLVIVVLVLLIIYLFKRV